MVTLGIKSLSASQLSQPVFAISPAIASPILQDEQHFLFLGWPSSQVTLVCPFQGMRVSLDKLPQAVFKAHCPAYAIPSTAGMGTHAHPLLWIPAQKPCNKWPRSVQSYPLLLFLWTSSYSFLSTPRVIADSLPLHPPFALFFQVLFKFSTFLQPSSFLPGWDSSSVRAVLPAYTSSRHSMSD